MKFIFIGTGSAFTVGGNYHSNMIFESDAKKRFLIDCGSDARHALYELGLDHSDLDAVYISHLHADHCGGLEWLAFKSMFNPQGPRSVALYCPEAIVGGLWNMLCGGLSSLDNEQANLSSYFDVHVIGENQQFEWEGAIFSAFPTVHQISNKELMPSYGLEVQVDGVHVLLTTDTRFPNDPEDPLHKKYKDADIIFQDCETGAVKSTVHAHYTELLELEPEIKKKMWLYHYQAGKLPDAVKDGFIGFVKKGQVFDFKDPKTLC